MASTAASTPGTAGGKGAGDDDAATGAEVPLDVAVAADDDSQWGLRGEAARPAPAGCGCFNSAVGFLVVICLYITVQSGAISAAAPAALSSLENRYGFSSAQSGSLLTAYSVGKLVSTFPTTQYFSTRHIPRHMGVMCALTGLSAFLFALPQWLDGTEYTPSGEVVSDGTCPQVPETTCEHESSTGVYIVLLLSQLLNGFAASTVYTLGPAYLDANADPKKVPTYLGILFACSALGALIFFMGTGAVLDAVPVDGAAIPGVADNSSPLWVGAWWLPFIAIGVLCWAIAPFFFLCPADIPGVGSSDPEATKSSKDKPESLAEIIVKVRKIVGNSVWTLSTLAIAAEAFVVAGYSAFGAKYMESNFSISAGTASFYAGAAVIPAAVMGMLGGGLVDSKYNQKLRDTSRFNVWMALVSAVAIAVTAAVACDPASVVGVNDDFVGVMAGPSIEASCNADCGCAANFAPVCVHDAEGAPHSFLNACVAGCKQLGVPNDSGEVTYANCSCVAAAGVGFQSDVADTGMCSELACKKMVPFLIAFFFVLLLTFANNSPGTCVLMQVLDPDLRGVGLAVNDIFYKVLGSIPGPILFGLVFDSNCQQTTFDTCGRPAGCAVYDNNALRIMFFPVLGLLGKGLSFVFFFSAWRLLVTSASWRHLGAKTKDADQKEVRRKSLVRRRSTLTGVPLQTVNPIQSALSGGAAGAGAGAAAGAAGARRA